MTAEEMVEQSKDTRFASQAALRLVSLLDQPDAGNDSVVDILRCDNVLTAKLLRACNSPYFGFSEISSVDQAVMLLGHQQILETVLALEFSATMQVPLPGYAVEAKELWHHSLATANAAELIAKTGMIDAELGAAFTAGLLHDIGKLVMNHVLIPERQSEIRSRISAGSARVVAEQEVLGTDHARVGAALLRKWNLPAAIVEAVEYHHQPMLKPSPGLSAIAHIADVSVHLAGSAPGWDAYAIAIQDDLAEELGITQERLELLVIDVRESFARVEEMMSMV
ncbi:MAG TPA: HDOD domain-containing protein [Verrucomicrobiae bacterium]|nr:HDOD domain-containing protein [Verrucomicrobiae bacterium]